MPKMPSPKSKKKESSGKKIDRKQPKKEFSDMEPKPKKPNQRFEP